MQKYCCFDTDCSPCPKFNGEIFSSINDDLEQCHECNKYKDYLKGKIKMFQVQCINEKGVKFTEQFDSVYLAKKFVNKCNRGKKVIVTDYNFILD